MIYKGSYAYKTNIGKVRKHNEDQAAVIVSENGDVLLLVCDGMGGSKKGDVASKIAIDTMVEEFKRKKKNRLAMGDRAWFLKAARNANNRIFDAAEKDPACKGMGTTLVAALISGSRLTLANIGDSRAYMSTKEGIRQISEDQTVVQYLLATGRITAEEASTHPDRHVLMNALGIFPSVSVDVNTFPYSGESVLLCTDGLYNQVPLQEIHAELNTDETASEKVAFLIAEADSYGGIDNEGLAYWEVNHD